MVRDTFFLRLLNKTFNYSGDKQMSSELVQPTRHDTSAGFLFVQFTAHFRAHGARFVVRGGRFTCVEGNSRSRHVVIEFPSYEQALACYHSPAYQAAVALRAPVSVADIVVIEGYDGPQP